MSDSSEESETLSEDESSSSSDSEEELSSESSSEESEDEVTVPAFLARGYLLDEFDARPRAVEKDVKVKPVGK